MLIKSIVLIFSLQLVLTTPQFVTFKDGKIGVNFGGYHAEAGLGGLLTGNAAHGGLSASAGTPWGPRAAAGLNGGVDGRAAGTAYAGAQLNPSVGASSVISGSTGDEQHGFAGAEAHTPGKTKSVVSTNSAFGGGLGGFVAGSEGSSAHTDGAQVTQSDQNVQTIKTSSVQKIKPHKKFTLVKNENTKSNVARSKHVVNSVYKEVRLPSGSTMITHENPANDQPVYHNYHQQPVAASNYETETVGVRAHAGGLVGSVLNIPIGILKSLQESLAGIQLQKSITYTKLA